MAIPARAILFDLDGTLLPHHFEDFLPRYLEAIARKFAAEFPGVEVIAALLNATRVMMANDGPRTNDEVFWADFAPRLGRAREEADPLFLRFYERDFPALRGDIARDPAAEAAVRAARDRGLKVVLATNPVFPAVALEERARWAGVDPSAFDLVTSYERMRSCKPRRSYYRQIAEELGVPPEACLMVGNDAALDLEPAAAVGMRTCLVASAFEVPLERFTPAHRCPLAEVSRLFEA